MATRQPKSSSSAKNVNAASFLDFILKFIGGILIFAALQPFYSYRWFLKGQLQGSPVVLRLVSLVTGVAFVVGAYSLAPASPASSSPSSASP